MFISESLNLRTASPSNNNDTSAPQPSSLDPTLAPRTPNDGIGASSNNAAALSSVSTTSAAASLAGGGACSNGNNSDKDNDESTGTSKQRKMSTSSAVDDSKNNNNNSSTHQPGLSPPNGLTGGLTPGAENETPRTAIDRSVLKRRGGLGLPSLPIRPNDGGGVGNAAGGRERRAAARMGRQGQQHHPRGMTNSLPQSQDGQQAVSPLITPESYHLKFCMARKRRKQQRGGGSDSMMMMGGPSVGMNMMEGNNSMMGPPNGMGMGGGDPMRERMMMDDFRGGGVGGGMFNDRFGANGMMGPPMSPGRMQMMMGGGRFGGMGGGGMPNNLQELREMMSRQPSRDGGSSSLMTPPDNDEEMSQRTGSQGSSAVRPMNSQGSEIASSSGRKSPGDINRKGSQDSSRGGGGRAATVNTNNPSSSQDYGRFNSSGSVNSGSHLDSFLNTMGMPTPNDMMRGSMMPNPNDMMRGSLLPTPTPNNMMKPNMRNLYKQGMMNQMSGGGGGMSGSGLGGGDGNGMGGMPSHSTGAGGVSFSPLDRMDRSLVARMLASGAAEGLTPQSMARPTLSALRGEYSKRKFSELPYSPRSPNPKKSLLERQRIMDMEMKAHMHEAMASFGRFQRKNSGSSDGHGQLGGVAGGLGGVAVNTPLDSTPNDAMRMPTSRENADGVVDSVKLPSLADVGGNMTKSAKPSTSPKTTSSGSKDAGISTVQVNPTSLSTSKVVKKEMSQKQATKVSEKPKRPFR